MFRLSCRSWIVGAILPSLSAWLGAIAAGDPQLPSPFRTGWGEEKAQTLSQTRARICLNGVWHFQPAAAASNPPPAAGWGFIQVPGAWHSDTWRIQPPGIVARGVGAAWLSFDPAKASMGWYERQIAVPAAWAGRAILLDLRRVSTDAIVFVNGRKAGALAWPGGPLDITTYVRPGQTDMLAILVLATGSDKDASAFTGLPVGAVPQQEQTLESRGLIGEVFLESRPAGPHVNDVFIAPSLQRRKIALRVEFVGLQQAGTASLTAGMLTPTGSVETQFEARVELAATDRQTVEVAWPWENPRLWDLGKPELYTLQLAVEGAENDIGLHDVYSQTFGFREFRIDGRDFLLNGRKIRLRPRCGSQDTANGVPEVMDRLIDAYRANGYNLSECWPADQEVRGSIDYDELWAERADAKGWAITGTALSMKRFIVGNDGKIRWNDSGVKAEWERRMQTALRKARNHPSVLMWGTTANLFGTAQDQNPRCIGRSFAETNAWWQRIAGAGREGGAIIKRNDPTRPVFTHNGADVGDLHTVNMYLNLLPLQDREEWPSQYATNGTLPFLPVEFGTPLHCSFMRGRLPFGDNICTEPWMTEFAAIYLGSRAYADESAAYRHAIASKFQGGQLYARWQGEPALEEAPAFQAVESLFIANTWRAWRTWNLSGGMIPWDDGHGWGHGAAAEQRVSLGAFTPGHRGCFFATMRRYSAEPYTEPAWRCLPAGETLAANNAPTLAWIAGSAGCFTEKDHSYRTLQPVEKQVILINDTESTLPYIYRWEVTVNGRPYAGDEDTGDIQAGTVLRDSVHFDAPPSVAGKANGEIKLMAKIGAQMHMDSFAFRVFPAAPTSATAVVSVFDPARKSATMLEGLGYATRVWGGESNAPMVVVGREALSSTSAPPADLQAYVREGGRLLVMIQSRDWLRQRAGFRIAEHLSRRVFRVATNHPALKGLDEEDLRDWPGQSTLLEPYPDYTGTADIPRYGWRWGARGTVSSAAMEKPHRSGWRPILECEFDLAYSPLMELDYGRGRVVLCTLDIEDHAQSDPAAERLARQLVEYARTAPLAPRVVATYLGDDAGAALLDRLGVVFRRASVVPSEGELLVLGDSPVVDPAGVKAFLDEGGKAFCLPTRHNTNAWLAVGMKQAKEFHGSLRPPAWPETTGLSTSDLRWRSDHEAWLVADSAGVERGADGLLGRRVVGKGVALIVQIDPDLLDADKLSYFRFTRWRQTRALSQLLSNMGATLAADHLFFAALRAKEGTKPSSGMYHPDYLDDFARGDDPYRYYRW